MTKNISKIMILMVATMLAACIDEDQQQEQLPIRLTTSISATRAFSATQETQLVSGEKVYVWANEETSGVVDWAQKAYIQAWNLTADGNGVLSSSNSYYYPSGSLSMVALHGNFSFSEGTHVFPGTVTHTVNTDQSNLANYVASDLLYWKQSGVIGSSGALSVAFGHKLSKIEIHLSSSEYTTAQLNDMEVTLNNVLPSADIDLTNGDISEVHGTETTIRPYKTNYVDYEAIIPPQSRPHDFIKVTYKGTVVNVEAQVTGFDTNERYVYNFDMNNKDIRKNPLWYISEYNVNYSDDNGYSWGTTPEEGYFFSWRNAVYAASSFEGWHLPTKYEYNSIIPGLDTTSDPSNINDVEALVINIFGDIATTDGSGAVYSRTAHLGFGYNSVTIGSTSYMTENSYWFRKSANVLYAIRYCESEFCSAWKYELADNGMTLESPTTLTITSVLLGTSLSTSQAQSLYGTTESNWSPLFANLQFVNGNDEARGAVRRVFAALGVGYSDGTISGQGYNGQFWSVTSHSNDHSFIMRFQDFTTSIGPTATQQFGAFSLTRTVRLFRDNLLANPVSFTMAANQDNNPLKYLAEYNYNGSGFYTNNNHTSPYWLCNWFFAYNNRNKTYTISNKGYHIGSYEEWNSIVPPGGGIFSAETNYTTIIQPEYDMYIKNGNRTIPSSLAVYVQTGAWDGSAERTTYGIRFIDTEYCSAWKYHREPTSRDVGSGGRLTIESFILGSRIKNTVDAEALLFKLANGTLSWPQSGTIKRQLPAIGTYGTLDESAASGQSVVVNSNRGSWAYYWNSTELNETQGRIMRCHQSLLYNGNYYGKGAGLPLRMFSN